jgi:hypothetical protein
MKGRDYYSVEGYKKSGRFITQDELIALALEADKYLGDACDETDDDGDDNNEDILASCEMHQVYSDTLGSCMDRMIGKGNSRHSEYTEPIVNHKWYSKGSTFDWGNAFQASKKLDEAKLLWDRGEQVKALDELHDAINYIMFEIYCLKGKMDI